MRLAIGLKPPQSMIVGMAQSKTLGHLTSCMDVDPLSDREHDVMALIASGLTNEAIAARLYLSLKSVESAIRSIFVKFGFCDDRSRNRRVMAVLRYLHTDPS